MELFVNLSVLMVQTLSTVFVFVQATKFSILVDVYHLVLLNTQTSITSVFAVKVLAPAVQQHHQHVLPVLEDTFSIQ